MPPGPLPQNTNPRSRVKVPLSVIVPIRNEAANLPGCLSSLQWADQLYVVDSHSQDGSAAIAQAFGAEVVQFEFHSPWPKKKNWALQTLPFRHDWVLLIDADETMPAPAEEEIREIVTSPAPPHAGYWINRRFHFMGDWLRHAYYPNWNLRLFRHRLGRFEKLTDLETESGDVEIHEHVHVQGSTGRLRCEMDHYAFPSVEAFVDKHNRYSNWEARLALSVPGANHAPQTRALRWRRFLKRAARRLPARPVLRFLYIYVLQLGFLDGRRGFYFASLHAYYEFLSLLKTIELKEAAKSK